MGEIPDDATHWDTGDWIEWHRTSLGVDHRPCAAAAQDQQAQMTALHINLLRAAKGYFEMTGHHLPVYPQIAHVHAAIFCDLPMDGPDRTCAQTGVEVACLAPHSPSDEVEVDLSHDFVTLIVVKISDDFTAQARMISRADLPKSKDGPYRVAWQALPHTF
ncbi:hypothetical protein CEP88_06255 [Roseobacter denitrificans]|uniref:Uncharacterized protein n=1 Tax=Roseobacter denitrificans (strain ATCC 33942 / OCh 114) TaxID=375451 RepID=Q163L2_ROSDO|nr:hypothetical protein [Roseobacter denitrificans]ABG32831.1 hypothetical protein RD1_3332 [Roseobacter denitrificans OCh 114]AVL52230.1 hypothetical protein CEP88_06255 [Roseobacter denitrificans]SFF95474.1 hypothetical protein SAMN05443635_104244 [Roseobacter denitrificans OCh 114]